MSIASDRAPASTVLLATGTEDGSVLSTALGAAADSGGDGFGESGDVEEDDAGVRKSMRPVPVYQREDDLRSTVFPLTAEMGTDPVRSLLGGGVLLIGVDEPVGEGLPPQLKLPMPSDGRVSHVCSEDEPDVGGVASPESGFGCRDVDSDCGRRDRRWRMRVGGKDDGWETWWAVERERRIEGEDEDDGGGRAGAVSVVGGQEGG